VQMIFAGNFACDTCRMYERNYPCDSLIAVYFGVLFPASPPASPSLLQRFTYLCMMAQVHTLPSLQPFRLLLMCALTRGPQSDAGDEERHRGAAQPQRARHADVAAGRDMADWRLGQPGVWNCRVVGWAGVGWAVEAAASCHGAASVSRCGGNLRRRRVVFREEQQRAACS